MDNTFNKLDNLFIIFLIEEIVKGLRQKDPDIRQTTDLLIIVLLTTDYSSLTTNYNPLTTDYSPSITDYNSPITDYSLLTADYSLSTAD